MRNRGAPVRCHNCKKASRYIDGSFWRCDQCGGIHFTVDLPAFRKTWWEQFNDMLLTNRNMERLEANPVFRRALFRPRQPKIIVGVR